MKKTLFPFGSSSRNSGRAMRATSLRLENLEDRQLLSVTDLVPLAAAASESAVETAPAAEDVAIDLSSVADQTETAYNEHDLAAVESLGMTADDSNVVWNAEGRVTSIVASAQTTLETANLSGCTALESFTCKGTVRAPNALASLDVSGCAALTTLDVGYCNITSVNLTDCAALETLNIYYNANLASLDLSDCAALKSLQAFNCSLTSIDVSDCPELERLMISTNQISSVDLSANSALTNINVMNNSLSALDVSNCPNLETINCSNNDIASRRAQESVSQQQRNDQPGAYLYGTSRTGRRLVRGSR